VSEKYQWWFSFSKPSNHFTANLVGLFLVRTNNSEHQINASAVATAMNYSNPRSVSNRIAALKKKYDLPFGSGKGTPTKSSDEPKAPTTPSKNRVTKSKAPAKKAATPKTKPRVEVKDEFSDEDMSVANTAKARGRSLLLHS
jgi:hypothetical protein